MLLFPCTKPLALLLTVLSVCSPGYHGQGGEVKVDSSNTLPLTDLWLKAGTQMGMDIIDPNAVHKEGSF